MVLFLIVSDDLTFPSNQVGVKTIDVSLVCLFGLNTLEEELVVENSTFSGFGGDLGECHFVGVANNGQKHVSFVDCVFEDASAKGAPSFEIEVENVNVIGCTFRRLSCQWTGAIHTGGMDEMGSCLSQYEHCFAILKHRKEVMSSNKRNQCLQDIDLGHVATRIHERSIPLSVGNGEGDHEENSNQKKA